MRPIRVMRSRSLVVVAVLACACSPAGATPGPGSATPQPPGETPMVRAPSATPEMTPAGGSPPPAATDPAGGSPSPAASPSAPAGSPSATAVAAPAWRRFEASAGPEARSDHTWTVDGGGTFAYLFGGTSSSGALDDLWRFDLDAGTWERLEPAGDRPPARFGHVAAWVDGTGLVLWSGQAGSDFFNDLWAYDPASAAWQRLPDGGAVPEARYGSCGAVGPDGRLWVSHGFTASGRFEDTRAYDFVAGAWSDVTPAGVHPVKRCLHDCLWTPNGAFLLYAGQTDGRPALGDLWSLDPAGGWTELPRPEPEARQLYALASSGGSAYVFGGRDADGALLDSAFTLDLASLAWAPLAADGEPPRARAGATLIADEARGRLLLFGGTGRDEPFDDLWELTMAGSAAASSGRGEPGSTP